MANMIVHAWSCEAVQFTIGVFNRKPSFAPWKRSFLTLHFLNQCHCFCGESCIVVFTTDEPFWGELWEMLREKGYRPAGGERPEGFGWNCWRAHSEELLTSLFPMTAY